MSSVSCNSMKEKFSLLEITELELDNRLNGKLLLRKSQTFNGKSEKSVMDRKDLSMYNILTVTS